MLRNSKHKEEIIEIISKSKKQLSSIEIFEKLKEKNIDINLSTVYRCVNKLCECNILLKDIHDDKTAYYTLNKKNHNHYIKCDVCKKEIKIDSCPLGNVLKEIEKETGFNITNHSIQLRGICKNCCNKKIK